MESVTGRKQSPLPGDGNTSDQSGAPTKPHEKVQEGVSTSTSSNKSKTEISNAHETTLKKKSDAADVVNHDDSSDTQQVFLQDSEPVGDVTVDTSNNTTDDTFCSNASSSINLEETKDVEIISESEAEEDSATKGDDGLDEPKSPDDMFASQPPEDTEGTQDPDSAMECSDLIPSSQSVESHSRITEAESSKSDQRESSSPFSRKRKLEIVDACDKKLPRIEEETPKSVQAANSSESTELPCKSLPNHVLVTKCDRVTTSEDVVEVTPKKNSGTEDDNCLESKKEPICSKKTVTELEKCKSERGSNSQEYKKNIEPEILECSSNSKSEKIEISRKRPRESLEIVFMSPKMSCSQDSPNVDTQVSSLQNDDKRPKLPESLSAVVEGEEISLKETNLRNTVPSSKSESSDSSCNPQKSLSSPGGNEKSNLADKSHVNGPDSSTEILTVDEDDDLQILSSKHSGNKAHVNGDDNNHSPLLLEGSPASNDVAIIDCKSNGSLSGTGISKSNGSVLKPGSASMFLRQKSVTTDVNGSQSLVNDEDAGAMRKKKKKDANKNNDIIRIGSDSETEDQSGPAMAKKTNVLDTPEDATHLNEVSKGIQMSTPYEATAKLLVCESFSSIELDDLRERTPQTVEELINRKDHTADTNGQPMELEKKIFLECRVKLKYNNQNQEILSWEVAQWDDITDELISNTTQHASDTSPGTLGDVSKGSSPSSVVSTGLFPLKSRHRISTSTSSSGGTSSTGNIGVSRLRPSLESVQFVKPFIKTLKDKSFSLESSLGKKPYIHTGRLKEYELNEKIERRLQQGINSDGENKEKWRDVLSDICHRIQPALPVDEKSKPQVSGGNKISSSTKGKDDNVALDITPKSTKKSHQRPSRATRNAPKVSGAKAAEQTRGGVGNKSALKQEVNASNEDNTPPRRGRNLKKTSSTAKKSNAGDAKSVSTDTAKKGKKSGTAGEEVKSSSSESSKSKKGKNEKNDSSNTSSSDGEVTLDWSVESCKTKLVPGARAFARWTDKRYYSAKVKENVKDDRWILEFDDGNVKTLKEEFIIPVNILTKGQIVFAPVEDDFDEGRIKKFKMKNNEVHYGIEIEGGEIIYVPPSKLFMTEDQARILQEDVAPKPTPATPKSTSVSVENIVEGKRSRSNRALFRVVEGPGVSGTAKVTPKRTTRSDPGRDTSRSSSVSDATDKESTSAFEEVGGVDPEAYSSPECTFTLNNRGKGPGRIKGKGRGTPRRLAPSNQSNDESENLILAESLGPIPREGSKIFEDMHFLLTYAGGAPNCNPTSGESGWETDDTIDKGASRNWSGPSKFKFVKGHLKAQLEAGGGKVYEHFKDVPAHLYSSCYLIADRPTETAKYILCLASGIKIVKFEWVIFRCQGNDYNINGAILPSGYSLEDNRLVEFQSKTRKKKPLNAMKVGLVNESKHFLDFWDKVLVALGAKVWKISSEEDKEFKSVKVIVTDSSCPPEMQERAREWNIPMVSTTWVKQCLIRWEFRPYDGHKHYRYDFCPLD